MSRLQLSSDGRIDLGIGQPDLRLLPLVELRAAAADRLARPETEILQYGPHEGSAPFRALLAEFLTDGYGVEVASEHLFTTQGASHALDLIAGRYTREGDTVLVEAPTYFHALKILRARHLNLVPVPVDADGLQVDALERILAQTQAKLLYTIPVHHNPRGVTLSAERREKLIGLARRHDFVIAADEVYQLLTYEGSVPPPLRTFGSDRVLSISSFSKLLAPGLRYGWVEADPGHLEALSGCGVIRSGGGASPFVSAILESAIEGGLLAGYLARIKETYALRMRTLTAALDQAGLSYVRPTGGFFVWLDDLGCDAAQLATAARSAGAGLLAGSRCTIDDGFPRAARVCFTYYRPEELTEAVRIIADVMGQTPLQSS